MQLVSNNCSWVDKMACSLQELDILDHNWPTSPHTVPAPGFSVCLWSHVYDGFQCSTDIQCQQMLTSVLTEPCWLAPCRCCQAFCLEDPFLDLWISICNRFYLFLLRIDVFPFKLFSSLALLALNNLLHFLLWFLDSLVWKRVKKRKMNYMSRFSAKHDDSVYSKINRYLIVWPDVY